MSKPILAVMVAGLVLAALGMEDPIPAATDPRAVEGTWSGSLQGALRIVVHVTRGPDGLRATLDSPDQGAAGLPIHTVRFTGDSLRFEMRRPEARFDGLMSKEGDRIVGEWSQSGLSLPLTLVRGAGTPPRRPQEPRPPYPYDTLEVSFPNPKATGVTLAGTLTLPRSRGPFPAAVLITGSGPEDRDETVFGHRPFRVLADRLTRDGIAVLRLDDRGVGGSTGDFARATSEDFASDVAAAVEFLRGRKEIHPKRIGLVGHSEGGLIAPLAAARARGVSYVVLMAGPGLRGDSLLLLQSATIRRRMGVGEDALAQERIVSRRMYARLRADDSTGALAAARELVTLQLAALPEEQRRAVGDPEEIATTVLRPLASPWMRFFVQYDPGPALERLECPVLAINGSKDQQVSASENLAGIRAALKRGGNRDFTVLELPGLNHLFQTSDTGDVGEYARIEETLAPLALDTIAGWILDHVGAKR